jgi:hypothetical protein
MNQTRPHRVNQTRKTHSKPIAARHGRGTAWARQAMCETAYSVSHQMSIFVLSACCLAGALVVP